MDAGSIIMMVLLVVVMPVGVLISMTALAAVLGGLVGHHSDRENLTEDGEPNEYLALANTNPYE